jgi:hypothetical protein
MHGFTAGQTVKKRIWIKIPSASGILGSEIALQMYDFQGDWQYTESLAANIYDQWQEVTLTRILRGACTGTIVRIKAVSTAALNEYFYVDDSSLQSNLAVRINATGHPFINDEFVRITGVVGMTQLNGNSYMVKNKTADTLELYGTDGVTPLNGIDFGLYVSGGLIEKVVKILTGLDHLEAKTVAVYADGVEMGQEVVVAGAITIDQYAAKIHVGLPYTGKMWTQRLGHFSPVRIPEALLLLSKSRGGKIGSDEASLKAIRYDTVDLKTGAQRVTIGGRFSEEGSIMIVQDQPLPMSILGIVGKLNVGE